MTGAAVPIDHLRAFVEQERVRFGVPGMALSLVVDGDTLLCEGFGHGNLDADEAVSADTHFPLASDTKAFTAASLCLLADQGRLELDAPVRTVLPWFELSDGHATALVTARDLLSHRTGLPRHDFVWHGDDELSMEQIVRGLRHLALSRPVRSTWDYNNLAYITAGHLDAVLRGTSWSQGVQDALLNPLGMHSTTFSVQDPRVVQLALPYKKVGDRYERQALPAKSTADKAGPAGGLVSTAADLSRWLLARLGAAPDVLPESLLAQLHGPAMLGGITVQPYPEIVSLGYALGCQVESYRGVRLVHHGGNITGYSSDVCVVPDRGIGIAVLTNLDSSYLRLAVMYGLLDRLLGLDAAPWGERMRTLMSSLLTGRDEALAHHRAEGSVAPPSRPLDGFTGAYEHPAYGRLLIRLHDGRLVPDFHGMGEQVRLEHRGHDAFDLCFPTLDVACPLVFQQGADGEIVGLSVALEQAVPPIVFPRVPPAVDPEVVSALLGTYQMGPHRLGVRRRGATLVASSAALGEVDLVPAANLRFTSSLPNVTFTAERPDDGPVQRLVVDGLGVFQRRADAPGGTTRSPRSAECAR